MFKTAGFGLAIALISSPAWSQDKPASDSDVLSSSGRTQPKADAQPKVDEPKPAVEVPPSDTKTVSVKAETEVLVEHREGANAPWKHVCASPCSFAPVGGEYRVIGVNVSPSEPFAVTGPGALKIDIGSAPKMRRGMWLTGIGGGVMAIGLVFVIAAQAFADPGPGGIIREDKIPFLAVGTSFLFAGAGVGIYGGATYYDNRRSTVTGPVGDLRPRGAGFMLPVAFTF
jgi:hypothetical protein